MSRRVFWLMVVVFLVLGVTLWGIAGALSSVARQAASNTCPQTIVLNPFAVQPRVPPKIAKPTPPVVTELPVPEQTSVPAK